MNYRLITIKYRDQGFYIYCRDEQNVRRVFLVTDFKPYFMIRRNEPPPQDPAVEGIISDRVSLHREPLQLIYTTRPGDVGRLREDYNDHWEADIPIERRFSIDARLFNFFEAPINDLPSPEAMEISWLDLTPIKGD